jgi:hypothetical protein
LACNFEAKFVLLVLLSVGCATIREVKKQPGKGGVITIQEGIFGEARSDAMQVPGRMRRDSL